MSRMRNGYHLAAAIASVFACGVSWAQGVGEPPAEVGAPAALAASASPTEAATSRLPRLSVQLGWGGLYRVGDWTPLSVRVPGSRGDGVNGDSGLGAGSILADGSVEVWAYQDARLTMVERTRVPRQPSDATINVPIRMGGLLDGHAVLLRNGAGQIVAAASLGNLPAAEAIAVGSGTSGAARLVAVASNAPSTVTPGDFVGAGVRVGQLPVWAELYQSLDLLVLSGMTLGELSLSQAQAIRSWVDAGGRLLVCASPEGFDDNDAAQMIRQILPARLGALETRSYPQRIVAARSLIPGANAKPAGMGFQTHVGLGTVYLSPVALSADTRKDIGEMVGSIAARVLSDPPKALEPPRDADRRQVMLALAALLLAAGLTEAVVRRAHDAWPWKLHVLCSVAFGLVGVVALALWPAGEARSNVPWTVLIDRVAGKDGKVVATTAYGRLTGLQFPTPVPPMNFRGTSHAVATLGFRDGAPVLESITDDIACVGALSADSHLMPDVSNVPAQDDVQESKGGITGRSPAIAGTEAIRVLPEPFASARRMTPIRSGQLQRALSTGTADLRWESWPTPDGTVIVRTTALKGPELAPAQPPTTRP